ncbi:L-2-amino-thiazoline-4-carboxylic acid hydrolase [Roseitranquillus sediminis]|uniref:L-2-amino-thiazoline-4-carboxylic acid hydrolase n=1 Tax=Roseitranquillus sediminis TaxID=2809051 RepID=UPI001D0BF902|nr:L-2-amino-thiazoline-4-carboxylic acid hydrolase [Roseitranquillus sediminis]MBM9595981.1 L-2-amino-thiazoline-4-carboxylic acid hydrolase [Roseitranquillus sediminis]
MDDMPILERRRIEAQILGQVYDTLRERSGEKEAQAVIGEAVSNAAVAHGRELAERLGRPPTLKDFHEIMPAWTKGDALEIEVIAADEEKLDFNVTRCRYAEMYRQMGLSDIGHLLSCNRDGDFCVGYNPDMKLTRTQTIMRGASHCDFRYRMEPQED